MGDSLLESAIICDLMLTSLERPDVQDESDFHEPRVRPIKVAIIEDQYEEGHNYKAAAATLGITINTVSFHARNIYSKLQVHSKSEAVAKALRNRLI